MTSETWPGESRRNPRRSSSTWVVRSALMRWLQAQADELHSRAPLRVLDVGCGAKPYYPLFAPIASGYVGVDAVPSEWSDLVGPAEALPVEDASFDLVLCTQVLEHADDPAQVVRELRRVTAPGGRVLASTHGVQWYHPSPHDHWRWTHTGLRLLFERNGDWSALAIEPAAGTGSTLAMVLANYVEVALRGTFIARGVVSLLNRGGAALDRGSPKLRDVRQGSLIANYHVVADVAAQAVG
jgi:SAM-dependent methyltransferase